MLLSFLFRCFYRLFMIIYHNLMIIYYKYIERDF